MNVMPCWEVSTPDEIAMTKGWLQHLQDYLPHSPHWHQMSSVPYNQELELRITEKAENVTLEFPCLRTNEDAWINVDLGTEIKVYGRMAYLAGR